MRRLLSSVLAVALSLAAAGRSLAEVITIVGDPGDGIVDVNGLPQDFSLPQLRVGVAGNNVRGHAPIFFFPLPTVPSRDAIVGAELRIQYLDITRATIVTPPEFNADLFGIGARTTPTILSTDYHDGDASLSADTLIVEGFITPATVPGSLQASGSNLLNFITSLYQPDGTPTAAFVVFRVNPDANLPPFSGRLRGYELASANNPNPAFVPQLRLNVNTVPEPRTLTLMLVAALLLAPLAHRMHRRRQIPGA